MSDSEKVRSIRHALGWNQDYMASVLGIDRSYLSQLENAARPISKKILAQISALEMEMRRLGGRDYPEKKGKQREPLSTKTKPAIEAQSISFQSQSSGIEWDVSKMTTDALVNLLGYIVERRNNAPVIAQALYCHASSEIHAELAKRLRLPVVPSILKLTKRTVQKSEK